MYIPHEKLTIDWSHTDDSFKLSLPWLSMDIDVEEADRRWIHDATDYLQTPGFNQNVQKFIGDLKDYPIFYIQPRTIHDFKGKDLQACPEIIVDSSSPSQLIATFDCKIAEELKKEAIAWVVAMRIFRFFPLAVFTWVFWVKPLKLKKVVSTIAVNSFPFRVSFTPPA